MCSLRVVSAVSFIPPPGDATHVADLPARFLSISPSPAVSTSLSTSHRHVARAADTFKDVLMNYLLHKRPARLRRSPPPTSLIVPRLRCRK